MSKTRHRVSLRPYQGQLFVALTREDYEKAHAKIFKRPDVLNCSQAGRFSGGEGENGEWTYLLWVSEPHNLAHEVAHVAFHVFERCGIEPVSGREEPFCYLLSQILLDIANLNKA